GLVVVSPGISPDDPDLGELLHTAMANGVEVVGEIELFARALGDMAQQGYKPDVVAVTGTNGKTTVTALVRSLAASVGRSVVAAGNIGPTALGALLDAMEARRLPELWALELSSFQLATTHSLHSQASVVLNIAQDHIDWHGS